MGQTRYISDYRTKILSVLFLVYYALIALLCWAILLHNPNEALQWIADKKELVLVLIFSGLSASSFLFITAMSAIERQFKWYWVKRNGLGLFTTCCDWILHLLLVAFPFLFASYGFELKQRLGVPCLLLSVLVILVVLTRHRVCRKLVSAGASV